MGCGVSKFVLEEESKGQNGELKILRRKGNHAAVADSTILNKRLLDISENNINNEKEAKVKASDNEEKRNVAKKEEEEEENDNGSSDSGDEKDNKIPENSILYPGSPSFRDYCVISYHSADSTNDGSSDGSTGESHDRCQLNHSKRPRKQETKRGRIGRGFRNVLQGGGPGKAKNLLKNPAASNDASQNLS